MEILGSFTQFVLTGVMSPAADEAKKDTSTALSKNFSLAYDKFVKILESCRKGDFSLLDMVVSQILQLVKEGKLINTPPIPDQLNGNLSVINSWLGGGKKFIPLYIASKDGFSAAAFHSKCDYKGATVVIVTSSEGYVFGGYAPVAWGGNGTTYTSDNSGQSFVFSLKNPRNAEPAKFKVSSNAHAIYSNPPYGPTFGSHAICCSHYSNSNNSSYTNISKGYSNTTGLAANTVCTGQTSFTSKEIEVYQVQ